MSTPEQGRRSTDRFDRRVTRFRRLVDLNAPRVIIAEEARRVVRASSQNRDSQLRVVLSELRELVYEIWLGVQIPACRTLHRLGIWHMDQGHGGFGCPFCGKGEDPEESSLDFEQVDSGVPNDL